MKCGTFGSTYYKIGTITPNKIYILNMTLDAIITLDADAAQSDQLV